MLRLLLSLAVTTAFLAACQAETGPATSATDMTVADTTLADGPTDSLARSAPGGPTPGEPNADSGRAQALGVALDSLEAFVVVLEQIEGPIAAWNRAEDAARLLRYLEQNSGAFALDMSQEEATQRYPEQVQRLNELEARRTAELERINQDGVSGRVLAEEMAKADAEARASGQ